MQPQPSIQKRGMITSNQNKFSNHTNNIPAYQNPEPARFNNKPQPLNYFSAPVLPRKPIRQQQDQGGYDLAKETQDYNDHPELYPVIVEQPGSDLSPEEMERLLVQEYANEQQGLPQQHPDDEEREFHGGKKLYDRQLMQQPMYDEPTMQILNDIASDESFPILVQYITQLSHLGRQAQARLIARAAAFQSKNQVFSNIQNQNDYMMAQDDFAYAQILSKSDYSTYDTNADYFTAEAIMEAQFNIRLRRSRNALNLLQINTQRQESIMGQHPQQEEERKLSRKIPFLGQYSG